MHGRGVLTAVALVVVLALRMPSECVADVQVRNATQSALVASLKDGTFDIHWLNTTDIECYTVHSAVCSLTPLGRSALLIVGGLGFTIPPLATIQEIRVSWSARITDARPEANQTHIRTVALVEPGGTRWPTPQPTQSAPWTSNWQEFTYPVPGNDPLWGLPGASPLTSATVWSDPLSGVALQIDNLNFITVEALARCVTVEITYSIPSTTVTSGTVSASTTSAPAPASTSGTVTAEAVAATTLSANTVSGSATSVSVTGGLAVASSALGVTTQTPTSVSSSTMSPPTPVAPVGPAGASIITSSSGSLLLQKIAIVAVALGCLAFFVAAAALYTWLRRKRRGGDAVFLSGDDVNMAEMPHDESYGSDESSEKGSDLDASEGSADDDDDDATLTEIVIGRELGKGQFGAVFLGTWGGTTKVACKRIESSTASDDASPDVGHMGTSEVLTEATRLRRMNHPNIVRYLGLYHGKDYVYIVMEYVPSGSLDMYLRKPDNRLITTDTALLGLCTDTAAGMQYLSNKRVVHGDLAARNVLVSITDGKLVAKIADFGLSVECTQRTESVGSQYHRIPKGVARQIAIRHSPPEVLREGRCSTKSDVWSFGVTMWEIYSFGHRPYSGITNNELLGQIENGLRLRRPQECPERVYEVMRLCWDIDPDQRPEFAHLFKGLGHAAIGSDHYNTMANLQPPEYDSDLAYQSTDADATDDPSTPLYHTNVIDDE